MTCKRYEDLLLPEMHSVKETGSQYTCITERHIQIMWFEQKYFNTMNTHDGLTIEVISPGIWNAEAGPDFKKAHLRIGGKEVRGDVEVHLSETGWNQHKHHLDPRYNNVVLHVSLWKANIKLPILTSSHQKIYQTCLENHLRISLNRILKLIDPDLYPFHEHTGTGKCAEAIFRQIPEKDIHAFFRSAAGWRLRQKALRLGSETSSPEEAILRGVSAALGYKNNAKAFVEIYKALCKVAYYPEKELYSHALNICGFFDMPFKKRWEEISYYKELLECNPESPDPLRIQLALSKIRPFNHPIRRLAYLVKLVRDKTHRQIYGSVLNMWKENWVGIKEKKGLQELKLSFTSLLPVYEDPFFNAHLTFSSPCSKVYLPLVGSPFFEKVLINCFFPLIFEDIVSRGDPEEVEVFFKLFSSISGEDTGKIKFLKQRFFGNSQRGNLLKISMIEQGAQQLHTDFCAVFEASCEGCPFVGRYVDLFRY